MRAARPLETTCAFEYRSRLQLHAARHRIGSHEDTSDTPSTPHRLAKWTSPLHGPSLIWKTVAA